LSHHLRLARSPLRDVTKRLGCHGDEIAVGNVGTNNGDAVAGEVGRCKRGEGVGSDGGQAVVGWVDLGRLVMIIERTQNKCKDV
jgi:hypothetical protein